MEEESKNQEQSQEQSLTDLNRTMCHLSMAIQQKEAELRGLREAYTEAWNTKQNLQREQIQIVRITPRKKKRSLCHVPLDELPVFLAKLSPEELIEALEELGVTEEEYKETNTEDCHEYSRT